jgi:hypothetical protein
MVAQLVSPASPRSLPTQRTPGPAKKNSFHHIHFSYKGTIQSFESVTNIEKNAGFWILRSRHKRGVEAFQFN